VCRLKVRPLATPSGKVEMVGAEHWLVKGLPELGDTYPWYNVWVSGGRYRCDCFFRAYGYVRKVRICSHIATVVLHRRQLRLRAESSSMLPRRTLRAVAEQGEEAAGPLRQVDIARVAGDRLPDEAG